MDWKRVVAVLIFPLLLTLYGVWNLAFGSQEVWVRLGYAIGLFVGLVALAVAGLVLFLLRKKEIQWGYWLIVSAGCVVVVMVGMIIFVRF